MMWNLSSYVDFFKPRPLHILGLLVMLLAAGVELWLIMELILLLTLQLYITKFCMFKILAVYAYNEFIQMYNEFSQQPAMVSYKPTAWGWCECVSLNHCKYLSPVIVKKKIEKTRKLVCSVTCVHSLQEVFHTVCSFIIVEKWYT